MSLARYIRKPSRLVTISCEWDELGKHCSYDFKYCGDKFQALIYCLTTVEGAKYDSFEITRIIDEEA